MQYFVSKATPRTILVMFDREDRLLEGLQEVVKKEKIDTAAIANATVSGGASGVTTGPALKRATSPPPRTNASPMTAASDSSLASSRPLQAICKPTGKPVVVGSGSETPHCSNTLPMRVLRSARLFHSSAGISV